MAQPIEANSRAYMESMLDLNKDDPETISESSPLEGISEVTNFFDGLDILVTGGSGFLGKLLVEKLLRACPKLGKLYMFMRAKKGKTPEERFKEHFNDVIYERLKRERPEFANQVVMIEGDTSQDDLGLAENDRQLLRERVQVVFHGAATVRFDESLRRAININVRGTKLVLFFAKEMKNLKAFIHISTAFSHCILKRIEEKFYETPMDPYKVLSLVDMLDDELLDHMTPKLIGKWPNTYAFSKALGEELVRKSSNGMPLSIVRPSIIIATHREPVPGWINNYYGPTGVVMGAAVGLLRTLHCERDKIADIIPADYVINNIIVAARDTSKKWEEKQLINNKINVDDPLIYNSVSSCQKPINWGSFMTKNEYYGRDVPSELVLWYYAFTLVKSLWLHNLFCFIFHTVPAAVVDVLAILSGREPIGVISYFSTQQWEFDNTNVIELWKRTSDVDRKKFYFNLDALDWDDFFYSHVRGLRVYIMKDPLHTIPQGRKKYQRLKYAHYAVVTMICLLMSWLLCSIYRAVLSFY